MALLVGSWQQIQAEVSRGNKMNGGRDPKVGLRVGVSFTQADAAVRGVPLSLVPVAKAIILATQEIEIRRITVQSHLGK
jgi:hypothetical protein